MSGTRTGTQPPAAPPPPATPPAATQPAGQTQAQVEGDAREAQGQGSGAPTNGNGAPTNGSDATGNLEERLNKGLERITAFLDKAAASARGEEEEEPAEAKLRREAMDRLEKVMAHLNAASMELGQLRSKIGSTQ
jgi:hypothetical protein